MRSRLALTAATAVLVPTVLALGAAPAVAGAGNPGGNNGTIKLSEVGGPEDQSNDPKLSCTFELQWYGFDAGSSLYSDVSFAGQGADAGVGVTVTGSTHVFVGEDAAGGGTDHDATQVYTLAFDRPAANATQGYHVKVTTENGGSKGADTKFKVFHVAPCATTPTEPTTPTGPTTEPTTEPDTEPVTEVPAPTTGAVSPWSWDWQYAAPACDTLTVDYPSNIPDGQANDVNVRFSTASGPFTLNFHRNQGTWGGRTVFEFAAHAHWPAGLASYAVSWVQVGGTNYHWQGTVACGESAPAAEAPAPATQAAAAPAAPAPAAAAPAAAAPAASLASPAGTVAQAAQLTGFRSGTVSVQKGSSLADEVVVVRTEADELTLQRLTKGSWRTARSVDVEADGSATVTYPRLTKRGTYRFRVLVDDVVSKTLTIRVL